MAEAAPRGRFLTGSTMGHVARMTMTGAAGLTFVFIVDAANLFWVSRLGDARLLAALGYAFAIQFFTVSIGVGMMIAATALVSRRIGQGEHAEARHQATASMILVCSVQLGVGLATVLFRHPLVGMAGAVGETADLAARYLLITMPSLAIMGFGLVGSAVLRAVGDGRRAMFVTLTSGAFAMIIDPFLIVWFGLGLDGAAIGLVISRLIMAGMALRFAIGVHDLFARATLAALVRTARPFVAIALPATLTQIAAPFGTYLLTTVISGYGDSAVAAWAVVNRLTVVAFGGLFSLGGAIGGILGQNFGAAQYDRLRATYRDALIFCSGYVALTWIALMLLSGVVSDGFGLDADGRALLWAFTHVGAGFSVFLGFHYVANAAFNTLDKPIFSTLTNWLRDGILMLPAAIWLAGIYGAAGAIYAQALVALTTGVLTAVWGWRFVASIGRNGAPDIDLSARRAYRDVNRYRRR